MNWINWVIARVYEFDNNNNNSNSNKGKIKRWKERWENDDLLLVRSPAPGLMKMLTKTQRIDHRRRTAFAFPMEQKERKIGEKKRKIHTFHHRVSTSSSFLRLPSCVFQQTLTAIPLFHGNAKAAHQFQPLYAQINQFDLSRFNVSFHSPISVALPHTLSSRIQFKLILSTE